MKPVATAQVPVIRRLAAVEQYRAGWLLKPLESSLAILFQLLAGCCLPMRSLLSLCISISCWGFLCAARYGGFVFESWKPCVASNAKPLDKSWPNRILICFHKCNSRMKWREVMARELVGVDLIKDCC
ncbi:hypothetical protein NA56DRAFT_226168 [Hyaloscypha hepaticicola]|uniref:Uncharacterized protein n=1 Tax=Hyaloscypha hepaticicola TaxID=2082293 RepID=A0A2J6QLJ7_9HELO|nr:hypothetical protein NA56DRAFT_226168 [Hyaloscypha hepaticicola]